MEVRPSSRPKREIKDKTSSIKAALDKLSRVRKGLVEDKYNMKEEEDLFVEGEEAGESDDDFLVDDTPSIKTFFTKRKKSGYDSESDEDDYYEEEENEEKVLSKKIKPPKPSTISVKIEKQEPEETQEDDAYEVLASTSKRLKGMFGSKNNTPQSADRRRSGLLKPLEASCSPSQKRKFDQDLTDSSKSKVNGVNGMDRKKVKIDFDAIRQDEMVKFEDEPDALLNESDDGPDISMDFGGGLESWAFGLKGVVDEEPVTKAADKDLTYYTDQNNVSHLKMYWLDAFEDLNVHAGRVYIFGKLKTKPDATSSSDHLSCCLIVENIARKVYLLPAMRGDNRIPVTEVHNEFAEKIASRFHIKLYKTRKVQAFYSFDQPDVPYQADYLEVVYGANYDPLPIDLKGETFSRVFHTTQSPLERLILEVNLKGPSWLRIQNLQVVHNQVSWCKKEFKVDYSLKNISVDTDDVTIPPLTITSLNLRTHLNQVVAISCFVKKDYQIDGGTPSIPLDLDQSFCLVTSPAGQNLPNEFNRAAKKFVKDHENLIKGYNNEQFMLNQFLVNFSKLDPDVIIGHDSAFDLSAIINRQAHFNDKINWSRLGRLRRTKIILSKSIKDRIATTAGRLVCDIQTLAKELIKAKSYDLDELIRHILKKERLIGPTSVPEAYSNCKNLFSYVNALLADNRFIMSIMYQLNALPISMQMTKIVGGLFSRTLVCGRSDRNEYLLLHAFHDKKFILPDKVVKKYNDPKADDGEVDAASGRKKAAYAGGLVLEPKVGFYDSHILLMDFNSLYPSIIQEYNICFTTVNRRKFTINENGDEIPELPDSSKACGVLPTEIKKLVESRREVKRLMLQEKSGDIKEQLEIKQLAFKLTANSMYGCLGFANSRFYAKPLAALVTYKGREILMHTKSLVEASGLEVIYGDTDSIMINTNCNDYNDVMAIGRKIQDNINKIYRLLEIGIDGVYHPMLLLKKKKYAANSLSSSDKGIVKKMEIKGLDAVRRDWSLIARKTSKAILEDILSGKTNQEIIEAIHEKLRIVATHIRKSTFTPEQLQDFIINKSLTKNPEEYQDKKSLIHVNVALRRNANAKVERKLKAGDNVHYIICINTNDEEFNALSYTQRAMHPDELEENASLQIDANYYISQQILPVVSRICEPIDGTDSHIMAEIMGIESTSLHRTSQEELDNEVPLDEELKYDSCRPFRTFCPNDSCGKAIEFRSQFKIDPVTKKRVNLSLAQCPHCNIDLCLEKYENRMINQFINHLRDAFDEYTKNWIICVHCNFKTRCCWGFQRERSRTLECARCGEDMDQLITDRQFHTQLCFYEHLLDRELALNSLSSASERSELEIATRPCESLYQALWQFVHQLRVSMAYTDVNLTDIFHTQLFSCLKKQFKK